MVEEKTNSSFSQTKNVTWKERRVGEELVACPFATLTASKLYYIIKLWLFLVSNAAILGLAFTPAGVMRSHEGQGACRKSAVLGTVFIVGDPPPDSTV